MCEHCGCRGVEPIAELMDEHLELLDHAGEVRRLPDAGRLDAAWERMGTMADLLVRDVAREEAGLFTALREQGDFADAVRELEDEHVSFDELVSELDITPHAEQAPSDAPEPRDMHGIDKLALEELERAHSSERDRDERETA